MLLGILALPGVVMVFRAPFGIGVDERGFDSTHGRRARRLLFEEEEEEEEDIS